MSRSRKFAVVLVVASGAVAAEAPEPQAPVALLAIAPPDSLSLERAATFDDTLSVLARSLRAFEAMESDPVLDELLAAMRESHATGDFESAAILSRDVWEHVHARRR
jgi:hypothetical protein